ncbi:MAG: ComF family protein [Hyphomicrobiales bacterium]
MRGSGELFRGARVLAADLLDMLTGAACPGCGGRAPRGRAVCATCDAAIGRTGIALCLRCLREGMVGGAAPADGGAGGSTDAGAGGCPRHGPDRLLLAGPRHEPPLDRVVRAYKYEGARALDRWIATLLPEPPGDATFRREAALVPVPLHPARLAWRGFDQARLLAAAAGRRWGIPVVEGLRRVRDHAPQARLGPDARRANVCGAFAVRPEAAALLRDRPLLLVDDVATTGSTLLEAADALAIAAPAWILSLAAAHGGPPDASEPSLHEAVAAPRRVW